MGATFRRYTDDPDNPWEDPLPGDGDPDYEAFIAAAGITDPTQQAAVAQLVFDLKAAGLWATLFALYPMVGGTAFSHKFNLIDPRDADEAFRLTFAGMWVHSDDGAEPHAAYARTHFIPTEHWTLTDGSMGFYSRTDDGNLGGPNYDMGCSTAGDARATIVVCHYWTGATYLDFATATYPSTMVGTGLGLFSVNQLGTTTEGYHNGAVVLTSPGNADTQPPIEVYLGANNTNGTASYYCTKQCAGAYFAHGLTDDENADLADAIQSFQTTLGRAV